MMVGNRSLNLINSKLGKLLHLDIALAADKKTLRNFGLLMGVMVPLMFGGILPYLFNFSHKIETLYIGGSFILIAIVYSPVLKTIYVPWMILGGVLGFINTQILLSIIYYVIFTPISILSRLTGKDALRLKRNTNQKSYRVKADGPRDIKHMERPF